MTTPVDQVASGTASAVYGTTENSKGAGGNSGYLVGVQDLQNQFMSILLTEMRYQDPMSPMDENSFFGQMAQFSAAKELQDLNAKVDGVIGLITKTGAQQDLFSAAKLIGMDFEAETAEGNVRGTIQSVTMKDGKVAVKWGDLAIPVEDLISVGGPDNAS